MANNNGIFITKTGVTVPVVTEMSASNWASYANNLSLALLRNTDHTFNAFEAFKFRVNILDAAGVAQQIFFNQKTNYVPSFIVGSGIHDDTTGEITASVEPLSVEEANKVFLNLSSLTLTQNGGAEVELRVASIDGDDYLLGNILTGVFTTVKNNAVVGVPTTTPVTQDGQNNINITSASIEFTNDTDGVLFSLARTWTATATGGVGVMQSSGAAAGSALPFATNDTLQGVDAVVSGTLVIASNFGQTTTYQVALGDALAVTNVSGQVDVSFIANQSSVHDVTDDFSGGVGVKSYAVSAGQLPTGISLTSSGLMQGIPSIDGVYQATVEIGDATGDKKYIVYNFAVHASANVSYNPPPAVEGKPYYYSPNISGVTGAVVTNGIIPPGLTLNALTGVLDGTPTASGTYAFSLQLTLSSIAEVIDTVVVVYEPMSAELFIDNASAGLVQNNDQKPVNLQDDSRIQISGGSGQFQYGISGGNLINSAGVMQLFETGEVTVTVTDVVTGDIIVFQMLVAGQAAICGVAVEPEEDTSSTNAPCVDIITDCNSPVTIGFNSMHILKGIGEGETPYREYPNFDDVEGAEVSNSGKMFAMFVSKSTNGRAVANNGKDGKPFMVTFAVSPSAYSAIGDVAVGVTRKFDPQNAVIGSLDFAAVITTANTIRSLELRKAGVYQTGSRVAITEGQEISFAVLSDSVAIYVDGLLVYQLVGNTFACAGVDIVFFAEPTNIIIGGRASNLVYSIETNGTVDQIGTIDAQLGVYTPSLNNVSLIRIAGTNSTNPDIVYNAKVRVIKPAVKTSLEKAMIEGIAVDMWIAGIDRYDDLPLRLDREGRPDRNQVDDPKHLGTLQGSGKMETAQTRTDFRNDRGATSSSLVVDKVTITGAALAVRDFSLVKRLVPYVKEYNSNGVRTLKQFSSGCHKRMRVFLVWQSPDCEDVPVFDAIEVVNGLSYTAFNIEVGQSIQSSLPVTIEGFPDKDGVLFDYNQYDKAFHRIGQ